MSDAQTAIRAYHATVQVRPDQERRFVEWKRREAEVQRTAYGFVKSLVLQPRNLPQMFVYMSFWDRADALAQLQRNPAFVDLSREFGVPMYAPEVRDGGTAGTVAPPVDHPMVAAPVERVRCSVLIDETGRNPGLSVADLMDPYAFHYFVDTGTAGAVAFENFKRVEARLQLDAPGFIKRLLLSRDDHPGGYYYFSLWTTTDAAHVFHDQFQASPEYSAAQANMQPFVVPPTFSDCTLVQDVSRAPSTQAAA